LSDNARRTGEFLRDQLFDLSRKYPNIIREVRGLGLMIGFELSPHIPGLAVEKTVTQAVQFVNRLHAAGLLTIPAGANVIRLLPALNLSRPEAEEGLKIIESVAAKLAK
jgi:acetylornithine/N-succinyldiaminopimelate aminotransferase